MKWRRISLLIGEKMYRNLDIISKRVGRTKSEIIRDGLISQIRKYRHYGYGIDNFFEDVGDSEVIEESLDKKKTRERRRKL